MRHRARWDRNMDWLAITVLSLLGALIVVFIIFVACVAYGEFVR